MQAFRLRVSTAPVKSRITLALSNSIESGNSMAQTYAQVQKQIETLQKQADKLKSVELAGVISKIKDAIRAYGITPRDLFATTATKGAKAFKSKAKLSKKAQYADGSGNEWVGRGPRPRWLRDALTAGKSLAEFAVGTARAVGGVEVAEVVAKKTSARKTAAKKKANMPKYRDDTGKSWTGIGPQPRWLKDAVAGGKRLEDFRV